jgi:serine/threonine protein kinase
MNSQAAATIERFGPFELVFDIGHGGSATTHLAIRRNPGEVIQKVCLKRIFTYVADDPVLKRELIEEARITARLRHPNIPGIIESGFLGDVYYLAIELVDGVDLQKLLHHMSGRGQRIDIDLAVWIGVQLAQALDHAHASRSAPVVHQDVAPSNVLLSRDGQVFLTDFGLARMLGPRFRTLAGAPRGKPPYMAPEHAADYVVHPLGDLFAWGAIMFELLAGRRAYEGSSGPNDPATFDLAARGEHPPLSSLRPDAPTDLIRIVEQMISPHPARRLGSARDILAALEPFPISVSAPSRIGALVRAMGPSFDRSLGHWAQQHPTSLGAHVDADATEFQRTAIRIVSSASLGEPTKASLPSTRDNLASDPHSADPIPATAIRPVVGPKPDSSHPRSASSRAGGRPSSRRMRLLLLFPLLFVLSAFLAWLALWLLAEL